MRQRRTTLSAGLLLLAGCFTFVSVPETAPSPQSVPAAIQCAIREATAMGFIVSNAGAETGFANLQREAEPSVRSVLGGQTFVDHIAVTAHSDSARGTQIRVQTYGMRHDGASTAPGPATRVLATDRAQLEAAELLGKCGTVADTTLQRIRAEFKAKAGAE